ncbi:fibronectin type III/BRCA1 domain-containing protein [Mycena floridula]|nr:fibronectin type III/BRCA1 domain-containing protein [Mycena floridula]
MADSYTFTVGKLGAGMAILLGERAHLIEFPSILLPPGATAGSIVNIAVHQNHSEEQRRDAEFWSLQQAIVDEFGVSLPEAPVLAVRNITQTSIALEWPPLELATSKLRSLDIYRNGQRLAAIPSPMNNTSTKVSGLEINSEYSFQLILRTTAGTFPSNLLRVVTHTMSDTSGISVCFGNVQDEVLLENAKMALREMGARYSEKIEIDTTHFICTTPAATPTGAESTGNAGGAPGVLYQRALQLSIPVLQPEWILACYSEKKMVPVASFYLGATPTTQTTFRPQSMSQASFQTKPAAITRQSMPPPVRTDSASPPSNNSSFVNQPQISTVQETVPAETEAQLERSDSAKSRKRRSGTMNRSFKFPSPSSSPVIPDALPPKGIKGPPSSLQNDAGDSKPAVMTPSVIEVPPPPPVEKERSKNTSNDDVEDEVGDTEEISLN